MEKIRYYCKKVRPYLTRTNIEIAALLLILCCGLFVFLSGQQSQAVLTFQDGTVKYSGQLLHNKPSGKGKLTFANGDVYDGEFAGGTFEGRGTFTSGTGWTYKGQFSAGQAHGSGVLTTETGAVYKGEFKEGVYQDEN